MSPNAAEALDGFTVSGSKTVVVLGGTQGIGAATARRLAQHGCDRIIIFGRNEKRGKEVIESMRDLFPNSKPDRFQGQFVSGDLSTNKATDASADALEHALDGTMIDILVLCQSGIPRGYIEENEDGNDKPFTIQVLSRFIILYRLLKHSCFAPDAVVIVVANTGKDLPDLSIEDLSLKERVGRKSKVGLFVQQSARDSVVLDSIVEEFHLRYPDYHFYHIFPGAVKTEGISAATEEIPFPLNWVTSFAGAILAVNPDQCALNLAYVALLNRKGDLGDNRYLGQKLQPKKLGSWAGSEERRRELWTKLVQMTGQN